MLLLDELSLTILEGCTVLSSSLEAVRMTAEGVFIIDVLDPSEAAVS